MPRLHVSLLTFCATATAFRPTAGPVHIQMRRPRVTQLRLTAAADNEGRFAAFATRPTTSELDLSSWKAINKGKVLNSNWKGVQFLKSPFDSMILVELLRELRPRSILELGALAGGSALFLADQSRALGLEPQPQIFSVELYPQGLDETALAAQADPAQRLTFLTPVNITSDLPALQPVLETLERPLLVLEDAHVTLGNTLRFLDEHILREGDYLVVEDTVDEAKRNELGEFLAGTPEGRYAVDTHLTDYFGENVCWNVNAYLRRMK
jgi:cephalosporin hydroxylase